MTFSIETHTPVERAARGRWVGRMGHLGFAAQGASFVIIAVLALALALGEGGKATDPSGAFTTIVEHAWGQALLVMLATGMAAHALWRFAQAFFDRGDEGARSRGLAKRAIQFVQGTAYAGLAVIAVRILLGGNPSSRRQTREATADVLSWPGGEFIVALAGIAIVIVAAFNAYWGVSERFKGSLRTDEMSPRVERIASRLGTVGFLSLAVVLVLVGWFLVDAARDHNADRTVTLGGALTKIADASYGEWLLGVVAAGILAFGFFGFVQARYHRT